MSDFDPFTATLEEAQAQPDAHATRGAVWRWIGANRLTHERVAFEGNPLWGMAVCAVHDLVAPDWLASAFLRCYRKVASCEVKTWDEAFGPAFPKGRNLAAARRARFNRPKVALAFSDILQRDPTRAVDAGLWEEIGVRVGEGKTRAEELYREALAMGMASSAKSIRSRGGVLVSSPAKFEKRAGLPKRRR